MPAVTRSLQLFVERTTVPFGKFLPDDLWSVQMLQLAHSSDCVRHALVALSAFHKRSRGGSSGGDDDGHVERHSLRQYNMAIRALREDPSMHLQLVSCTIFVCIEILRRNMTNIISLLKHGCALLCGAHTTVASTDKITRMVGAFFARIAAQVFLVIGGNTAHGLTATILPTLQISTQQPEPRAISPIAEAREWLLRLAVESQRDMPAAAMTTLLRCFEGWCAAFVDFKWSVAGAVTDQLLGPPEGRVLALLELHRRYLSINIAAVDQTEVESPSSWDQWADELRDMVGFAEKAGGVDSGPKFHVEIGVLPTRFA